MPKGDRYCRFSQLDFEEFLGVQPDGKPLEKGGFYRIPVPGTIELVYAKKVGPDLSLRIYSTIEGGFARTKDSDAIRVAIVWRPTEDEQARMLRDGVIDKDTKWPMPVGGETKVLRVQTWRDNLGERLANYDQIMPPRCDCGCPKVYRKPKKRKGQTWSAFWGCVLYKRCPVKNGVRPTPPVRTEPKLVPQRPTQKVASIPTPLEATSNKWDAMPAWLPIPQDRRRQGSNIPYDQPPY